MCARAHILFNSPLHQQVEFVICHANEKWTPNVGFLAKSLTSPSKGTALYRYNNCY